MEKTPSTPARSKSQRIAKWVIRIGCVILLLIAAVAAFAFVREFIASRKDAKRFPPEGLKIDVGGYALNLNCTGSGTPTVILESGWSMPGASWSLVQPKVAKFTRVCSYDRAGYGWSDEGPTPRTSDEIARELHTLLNNAGIKPPYILAGHSLAGYILRCFRGMHPDEVAGMVLVDPSQEDMTPLMPRELLRGIQSQTDQFKRFAPIFPMLQHLGVIRFMVHQQQEDYRLPPDLLEEIVFLSSQPKALKTMISELDAATDMQQDPLQVRRYGSRPGAMGDLPVIVLSAGVPPKDPSIPGLDQFMNSVITDLHPRIAHLSTKGKQVVVDASHFIPFEKPQAVVMAIQEVYAMVPKRGTNQGR